MLSIDTVTVTGKILYPTNLNNYANVTGYVTNAPRITICVRVCARMRVRARMYIYNNNIVTFIYLLGQLTEIIKNLRSHSSVTSGYKKHNSL